MGTPERYPIFALHSGGTTPMLWAPVVERLPDLRCSVPDLNDIAEQLPPDASYGDLVDVLAAGAPEGPLVVAGTGLGGRIAIAVATRLGARVRHLYLATPGPAEEDEDFRQKVAGLRRFLIDGFRPEALPSLVPVMLHRYGPRFRQASAELERILLDGSGQNGMPLARLVSDLGPLSQDLLPQLSATIEVVYGAGNPIVEPHWIESWRRLPQTRSVEVVQDAAHELALEIPDRLAADLRRLAEVG